jgi:Fur family transcriptional regulator, peroxide stress response regulator
MKKIIPTSEDIKRTLIDTLKKNNLKLTRQRLAIVEVLSNDRSHLSARAIFEKVRQKVSSISLSTVYVALNFFKNEGAIKELGFYDLENRYESDVREHLDLICLGCGRIINYDEPIPMLKERVEQKTGFAMNRMRYEYYGYCKKCKQKKG